MVRFDQCRPILIILAAASALSYLIAPVASVLPLFLLAFTVYFFRDPDRTVPEGKDILISPADGRVLDIEDVDDPYVGKARRLSIFMSPFDVHVNRAPIECIVKSVTYTPGKKFAAYKKEGLETRERNRLELIGTVRLAVEQYAGLVARRTVSWVRESNALKAGERFGMIRFSSRVDLIAPLNVGFTVTKGQRVTAGETITGKING
ncbi:MAG: phosphatidylserine decarboxylase [Candidatus Altiarchaeota archaeon]